MIGDLPDAGTAETINPPMLKRDLVSKFVLERSMDLLTVAARFAWLPNRDIKMPIPRVKRKTKPSLSINGSVGS